MGGLGSISRAGGGHLARSLSYGVASAAKSLPLPDPPPKPPAAVGPVATMVARCPGNRVNSSGGRPVGNGPRLFPYEDRGFRVGRLGAER